MHKKLAVFIGIVSFVLFLTKFNTAFALPNKTSVIPKPTFPPFPTIRAIPEVPKFSKDPIEQRLNSTKNNAQLKINSLSVQAENSELTVWVDQSFSGTSDGTEGSPYKDIFTAISTPSVDSLHINIKPGTYDENSHDLIASMKSKSVEFIGVTSEKPVIKTEFISCANKVIILTNIKVVGKTTAFDCDDGVILAFNDSDITADDDVVHLGGDPLIIAKNTNLSASKKSLNFLNGALVELKDSQLTGSIVTGDNFLLSSERVKVQGSIYTGSYPLLEIIDGTVNGSISTSDNMLLSANKLILQGSLDIADEAMIELIQSQISDSLRAGENLLLSSENSDIQNSLIGGNQVLLEFNNGTLGGQMNLLNDALILLESFKINKSINVLDKANISLTNSQVGESVVAGDDLLLLSDKTSIAGSINGKDKANIDLKNSFVNNQVKLGNEALISANNTHFSQTINSLNKTLLSLTSSKMRQIMLGDDNFIAIDKGTIKCSDSSKNGISTGERNLLAIQNSIISGCNRAIDVLEDTILGINLSTITNTSSDAISYHGNLKLSQDLEGNVSESFHIENSIFSNITGYVVNLSNYDPNILPKPKAKIYYNDFWQTQGLSQGISEFCESCTPNYNWDPLFKNPQEDDFHLLPNSPAINAGNPDSDYSQEPMPNGGRVDLGAYGNNIETTSNIEKLPVIFIPGTFGTRLFLDNVNKPCEGEIWLPEDLVELEKLLCLNALKPDSNGKGFYDKTYESGIMRPFGVMETIPIKKTDIYKAFINFMDSNGLPAEIRNSENPLFYIFYYDWRLSIEDNANKLNNYIDEVLTRVNKTSKKEQWTINQVNLIGHNQGGIVARQIAASNPEGNQKIKKIIYVGAPFYGVIQPLEVLEYGPTDIFDFHPGVLSPFVGKMLQGSIKNMPALIQLLPSNNYEKVYSNFFSIDRQSFSYNDFTRWLKDTFNNNISNWIQPVHRLDDPSNWINEAKNIQQYFLIGTELSTPAKIKEKTIKFINNYTTEHKLVHVFGDGTVTAGSAQWMLLNNNPKFDITRFFFPKIQHGTFLSYFSVQNCILDILKSISNSTLTNCPTYSSKIVKGKLISVHSPIRLSVSDKQGNHTGYLENGAIEVGIPESTFNSIGDEQFLFLPEKPDEYKIVLFPTVGQGEFTLQIENLSSDENGEFNPSKSALFNNISINSKDQQFNATFNGTADVDEIKLTSSINQEEPQILEPNSIVSGESVNDDNPPTTKIILTGVEGKEKWFKSKVEVTINSHDSESGTLETLYSLDGSKQKYLTSFNVESEGKHNLESTSVDKMGNWQHTPATEDFGIDLKLPEINIDPNKSVYKKGEILKVDLIDILSGIDKAFIKLDEKAVEGKSIILDQPGIHTLSIEVSDKAGNISQKQYEFTVVEYNILINNNDEFTNNRIAGLTLVYPDDTEKVRIYERPFSNNDRQPMWQNVTQSKNWFLKGTDGDKTVYAQFNGKSGKVSDVISDSIILDTRPPRGRVKIIRNNNSNQVKLAIDATDNISGVSQMMVSNNISFSGVPWQPYSKQIEWTLNPIGGRLMKLASVFVRFKDGAGNVSILTMDWILIH